MKANYFSSLVLGLSLFFSFSASAHTHIQETVPAKESVVKTAPQEVSIKFSEDLETAMSQIEVKNLTTGEIVSEKAIAGSNKATLLTHLKNEKTNFKATKYEVTWKAVSKDSHTMKGSYSFTVDPSSK